MARVRPIRNFLSNLFKDPEQEAINQLQESLENEGIDVPAGLDLEGLAEFAKEERGLRETSEVLSRILPPREVTRQVEQVTPAQPVTFDITNLLQPTKVDTGLETQIVPETVQEPVPQQDILGILRGSSLLGKEFTADILTEISGLGGGTEEDQLKTRPIGQDLATVLNQRIGAEVFNPNSTFGEVNLVAGKIPTKMPEGFRLTVDPDTGEITFEQGTGVTKPTETRFEQDIDNILSTLGVVDDMREIMTPETVGLIASVERTVQGVIEQGGAIGEAFNRMRADVETNKAKFNRKDLNNLAKFSKQKFNLLDPNINAAKFLEGLLTFRVAKTFDPAGRLNQDDVRRAEEAIGTGETFIGVQGFGDRLNAFEKFAVREIKRKRRKIGVTFDTRYNELKKLGLDDTAIFEILIQERF